MIEKLTLFTLVLAGSAIGGGECHVASGGR
jgi:hypothetical protein